MIEDRIKHRHLTCFEEVARQKSIGRAAHALAISQPAVSKTIRELEEILGVELFDRNHRSVVLTTFGEVFLRYASASISALRQGVESVDMAAKSGRTVIRVGALPSAAAQLLPRVVERFMRAGTTAAVRIVSADNATLLSRVRMGEFDFALVRVASFGNMVGLAFEHLYHERLTFTVRPGHPLLEGDEPVFARLSSYPVLVPPPESILYGAVERTLVRFGVGPIPRRIETIAPVFALPLVMTTDAVWIAPHGEVDADIAGGRLADLGVDTSEALGAVGLARRVEVECSAAANVFMGLIREVAGEVRSFVPG